jgi:hypothetical protein
LPFAVSFRVSELKLDILSFDITKFPQSRPNRVDTGGFTNLSARRYIPYAENFPRLLRMDSHAMGKERRTESEHRDSFAHVFFSKSLRSSLDT